MSIQFKFRSSVNFDSVDLDGQLSISIRDLRSKIARQKNLNVSQDFDLVFSDAVTGQEFKDEKLQIPSGSSVIIKRVPAGTVPSVRETFGSDANDGTKVLKLVAPVSGQVDDFDDFGIDLCPVPEVTFPDSYPEFDQMKCTGSADEDVAGSSSRWKHEASEISEAVPRDSGTEGQILQNKLEVQEPIKLQKKASAHSLDPQYADLPSELRCSLCDNFFKEAVMIPCCQHSFCGKCIREVLVVETTCPKCSSTKCRVEDLLPNLSLRQAIEHFLESRNLTTSMDNANALQKYAPDGESGIQVMNFSSAVPVTKKKPNMPSSPSATEKGSNQVMAQSFCENLGRKNTSLEGSSYPLPSSLRGRQLNGNLNGPEDLAAAADFQGENQPIRWPQYHVADKGGERNYMTAGGKKKVDRSCYMCGSPDHFIRNCPVASTPHPMFQTGEPIYQAGMPGYASSYWNSAAFPPIQPYMNMYGNLGMMPFGANMVPATPYAVPQYVPSMYGGFPIHSGMTRIGGLVPPVGTAHLPVNHSELLEIQDCENRRKWSNEWRGDPSSYEDDDRHHFDELERSDHYKSHTARKKSSTESEDSRSRNLRKKHEHEKLLDEKIQSVNETYDDERYEKTSRSTGAGRDRLSHRSERSKSGVENMHHSADRYSDARHKHHHKSSKKHHESRGHSGSDSSWSHHNPSKKERAVKNKLDVKDSNYKHTSHSSSGFEPRSSGDQKKRVKDKDHRHSVGDFKDRSKPIKDEFSTDRWQMADGSYEDFRDSNHHYKRKRVL